MADTQSYFYMRIKENFFDGDEHNYLLETSLEVVIRESE